MFDQGKLIGPFKQILTMEGLPIKGALSDDQLPITKDSWMLIVDQKIQSIGDYDELVGKSEHLDLEINHLTGDFVCLPGFVDCHTHICFGGSRARDYALRNSGVSYLEIAMAGGGIWDTVQQTRNQNLQALKKGIVRRSRRHLSEGVTTIEVKSGYGLSTEEEIKMLKAIELANKHCSTDLIATCLAAHIIPKDFDGNESEYLKHLVSELLPQIKSEGLANRVDIFIEQSAFSVDAAKPYLEAANQMGFSTTIHADQFTTGGSNLAVELKSVSADHLEASTDKEIEQLANSSTIAVVLPGASMGLGMAYSPARKLLDKGAAVAIASDWNPGSAPMGDLLLQACVMGAAEKLSNAELLAGITYRAALALELEDRGRLLPGNMADFLVFPVGDFREIFYHQGKIKPNMVFKNGSLAWTENLLN